MSNIVGIKLLNENAKMPFRAMGGDVGYDLFSSEHTTLLPQSVSKIPLGISYDMDINSNFHPKIEGRSSLASRGLFPVGGIADRGYRGELNVMLYNGTTDSVVLERGSKIAQLVFYNITTPELRKVDEVSSTERGSGGFGSTGK